MFKIFASKVRINKLFELSIGIKAAVVYTLASLITKGISIITIPIFTRFLTTSEMGLVTLYTSWFSLLSVLVSLGVDSGSFNVAMVEFKEERSEYMSVALFMSTLSTLAVFLIYILFHKSISNFFEIPSVLVMLMILGFLVTPALNMWMSRQRFEYKYKSVLAISLLSTIFASLFSVICIMLFSRYEEMNLGVIRLLSNYLIMYGIALIFYFYVIMRGKKVFNKEYMHFAITTGFPLIIHSLAKQLLDISDRIMIAWIVGNWAVGIYGVLYSVSTLSLIVWNAINNSIIPFMFNNIDKSKEQEKNLSKVTENLLVLYAMICITLSLLAPEIVRVLATQEYYEAVYLIPPISAGIFFTALYNLFSNVLLFYKKTKYIMLATLSAAALNIILNLFFIPIYGYIAASYTTLVSYILLSILQYLFMNHARNQRPLFNINKIGIVSMIILIISMIVNLLYKYFFVRYAIIVVFLFSAYKNKGIIFNTLSSIKSKES